VLKKIDEINEFREGYLHSQLLNNYSNKIWNRTIARLRFNYGETIKKTGPVCIDIGPGRGEMLDLLVKSGKLSVAAVDINEDVVSMIEAKFPSVGVELTSNTADFFSKKVNKYNLITMLHVLEHI
jgi:2-polyprenyl-3-methyl-5-hydroxy-6-metoxy-1,4-benzoquinol methylase